MAHGSLEIVTKGKTPWNPSNINMTPQGWHWTSECITHSKMILI